MTEVRVLRGGAGTPVVLLLHGLGATADVWAGLTGLLGSAWVAPDLPGHGGSAALERYTFAATADAVAELVDPAGTIVVGHSFGGVVGLHLASRPGVRAVVGVGVKVAWTAEELAKAAAFAERPPQVFPSAAEAGARHLRVAGLSGGDVPPAAVVAVDGGWRTAHDPRTFAVGDPGMAGLLAKVPAGVRVVLARGEHDRMVSREQLAAIVSDPVDLPGLGHNAHVEDPAALLGLLP